MYTFDGQRNVNILSDEYREARVQWYKSIRERICVTMHEHIDQELAC